MSRFINDKLRFFVGKRANLTCEYCKVHQNDLIFGCHIDHIIRIKHGGKTIVNNLAFSCFNCNSNKGSDIGSILQNSTRFIRFFNPRKDKWIQHFKYENGVIVPLTNIAEVTSNILQFNTADRIFQRQLLEISGKYPQK
jgi:hypothetical protein